MLKQVIYDGIIFEKQQYGGISRVFSELISRIHNHMDSDIEIITCNKWICKFRPQNESISYRKLPAFSKLLKPNQIFGHGSFYNNLIKSLYLLVKRNAIWHSTEYTVPLFATGPVICTIHDMIPEIYGDLIPDSYLIKIIPKKKRAIAKSDVIVAVSESTKNDIVKVYPEIDKNKIHVIYNSYNKSVFYNRSIEREKFLLYVGGRADYKGFKVLVKALNEWQEKDDYKLLVIGSKLDEAERRMCDFDIISMQGVSDEDLASLYSKAAAFVYPSFYEGFGIPLLEAMACKCPVVASEIPSTKEVANKAPYYFSPGNEIELRKALEMAIEKREWDLKEKLYNERINIFDWEYSAQKLSSLYKKLSS